MASRLKWPMASLASDLITGGLFKPLMATTSFASFSPWLATKVYKPLLENATSLEMCTYGSERIKRELFVYCMPFIQLFCSNDLLLLRMWFTLFSIASRNSYTPKKSFHHIPSILLA